MSLRRLSVFLVSLIGVALLTCAALLMSVRTVSARPLPAEAGTQVIQSATLRLWPEYDKPGLLVIFDGTFSNTVTFPQDVEFTLPGGAHDIQATMKDAAGSLLTQAWHMDGNKLIFTLPGPDFQVEYYVDTPLLGSQRNVSYDFQAPYHIDQLDIEVQQPARATAFSVVPQPSSSSPGSDGLTYYHLQQANLAAGDSLPISIQYTKTDPGTSVTVQPAAAPAAALGGPSGAAGEGAGKVSLMTILPWVLIGLGAAVFAGSIAYYLLLQRRPAAQTSSPSTRTPRATPEGSVAQAASGGTGSGPAGFCPKCGRRFGAADRFCPQCGSPRRR